MKSFLKKVKIKSEPGTRFKEQDQLPRQVNSLFNVLADIYGSDKIVLRAGKMNVLQMMRSEYLPERALALQKLVFEDPTLDTVPEPEKLPQILDEIEDEIADIIARRTVEDELDKKINALFKLGSWQHDHPTATCASDAKVDPCTHDLPLIGAAGVLLAHLNNIAYIIFYQHNKPPVCPRP